MSEAKSIVNLDKLTFKNTNAVLSSVFELFIVLVIADLIVKKSY